MQLLFYSLYSCFLNVKVGACLFYCLEIYVSLPLLSIVFMECVHLPAWEIDIQKKHTVNENIVFDNLKRHK